MDEALKQIGERLKGLRESLDVSVQEMAETCGVTEEKYLKMEGGESDLAVSRLYKLSRKYGVSLDVLMFGEEPRMDAYFLTRRNQGPTVERRKDYKYQSLARGFRGRKVDPFMVQVDPLPDDVKFSKNAHDGQEFDIVTEGRLELTIGEKVLILEVGDSIYFDARQPHCMRALDGKPVRFLCIAI